MTEVEGELCFLLLKKYFGSIVSNVGKYLCKNGAQFLGQIIVGTKLKPALVKKALCVLVQHKLVKFFIIKKRVEYRLVIANILQLLQIPKIIYSTKLLYGDPGELIIEELLVNGMATMANTIDTVMKRLKDLSEGHDDEVVKKVFEDLVHTRFLVIEPEIEEEGKNEEKEEPAIGENLKGRKRLLSSDNDTGPDAKRQKRSDDYYSINHARFCQYFRDQIIIRGISEKFGSVCGEIIRTFLRISEVTTSSDAKVTQPISSNEIKHALPLDVTIPISHVEQYLNIMMNDEGNFVQKSDESSSSMYVVNLRKCINQISHTHVLSYVHERFGSKCCRIFKLLMLKQHMEQKQVEDLAMIPSKEAKELLYQMWAENILVMQEIPKTADHAPSRTYYLFKVDLKKVVRTLISRSHRTLVNLLARQQFEMKSSKRLLQKRERIESIKASLQEADKSQLDEIEEMLTPAERDHLQKFEHCCSKLGKSLIQVANTAFLFNLYISQ